MPPSAARSYHSRGLRHVARDRSPAGVARARPRTPPPRRRSGRRWSAAAIRWCGRPAGWRELAPRQPASPRRARRASAPDRRTAAVRAPALRRRLAGRKDGRQGAVDRLGECDGAVDCRCDAAAVSAARAWRAQPERLERAGGGAGALGIDATTSRARRRADWRWPVAMRRSIAAAVEAAGENLQGADRQHDRRGGEQQRPLAVEDRLAEAGERRPAFPWPSSAPRGLAASSAAACAARRAAAMKSARRSRGSFSGAGWPAFAAGAALRQVAARPASSRCR